MRPQIPTQLERVVRRTNVGCAKNMVILEHALRGCGMMKDKNVGGISIENIQQILTAILTWYAFLVFYL
jgi:hypothetical protein